MQQEIIKFTYRYTVCNDKYFMDF